MVKNKNLLIAKKAKNDEFYTRYEDIEKELQYYTTELKDKIIYCNCDDYRISNFVKYFYYNFETTGIKLLIATNYNIGEGSYEYRYDGREEIITEIEDGSYDSERCLSILNESDIIVTNPPFSLFREYVAQLMEYGKKFLIIGNQNAITYKEIFPYIKNNELWMGTTNNTGMYYIVPKGHEYAPTYKFEKEINGVSVCRVPSVCWFTNITHARRNTELDLYKKYSADEYPKYDNYDAIEVSKVSEIPMDYDGLMAVPITFLYKYCSTQFEIIGLMSRAKSYVNGKGVYARILIRRR